MSLSAAALADRLAVALDAARLAGAMALEMQSALENGEIPVEVKGHQDFVTVADRKAEEIIRKCILTAFPEDAVVGEEFGGTSSGGPTWVIDPIDGTSNYVRGLPLWCVSIALVDAGVVSIGVIYDPCLNTIYQAIAGNGAYRNSSQIRASRKTELTEALIVLGTSPKSNHEHHVALLRYIREAGAETRRLGSAALGLAYVSCGRCDAYFESALNSWDALAGLLIASEAGAVSCSLKLQRFMTATGPVLCGDREVVELIKGGLPQVTGALLTDWAAPESLGDQSNSDGGSI